MANSFQVNVSTNINNDDNETAIVISPLPDCKNKRIWYENAKLCENASFFFVT